MMKSNPTNHPTNKVVSLPTIVTSIALVVLLQVILYLVFLGGPRRMVILFAGGSFLSLLPLLLGFAGSALLGWSIAKAWNTGAYPKNTLPLFGGVGVLLVVLGEGLSLSNVLGSFVKTLPTSQHSPLGLVLQNIEHGKRAEVLAALVLLGLCFTLCLLSTTVLLRAKPKQWSRVIPGMIVTFLFLSGLTLMGTLAEAPVFSLALLATLALFAAASVGTPTAQTEKVNIDQGEKESQDFDEITSENIPTQDLINDSKISVYWATLWGGFGVIGSSILFTKGASIFTHVRYLNLATPGSTLPPLSNPTLWMFGTFAVVVPLAISLWNLRFLCPWNDRTIQRSAGVLTLGLILALGSFHMFDSVVSQKIRSATQGKFHSHNNLTYSFKEKLRNSSLEKKLFQRARKPIQTLVELMQFAKAFDRPVSHHNALVLSKDSMYLIGKESKTALVPARNGVSSRITGSQIFPSLFQSLLQRRPPMRNLLRSKTGAKFNGLLLVYTAPDVPFKTIETVLNTAHLAGYKRFRFMIEGLVSVRYRSRQILLRKIGWQASFQWKPGVPLKKIHAALLRKKQQQKNQSNTHFLKDKFVRFAPTIAGKNQNMQATERKQALLYVKNKRVSLHTTNGQEKDKTLWKKKQQGGQKEASGCAKHLALYWKGTQRVQRQLLLSVDPKVPFYKVLNALEMTRRHDTPAHTLTLIRKKS